MTPLEHEQRLTSVFGELVYAVDTVIERHNDLEAKHTELAARLDTVSERLLVLEQLRGEH